MIIRVLHILACHSVHSQDVCLFQLYVTCLRVLCNQLQEDRNDTCHTLQQAADLDCDKKVSKMPYPGRNWRMKMRRWTLSTVKKVVTLADLLQKAGCPDAGEAERSSV